MKKVLLTIVALVLAIGLTIPMAAPVIANGPPATIDLPVTYRDFHAADWGGDTYYGHPDFEADPSLNGGYRVVTGLVSSTLGGDKKPVYNGSGSGDWTHGASYFDMWYNDTASYNQSWASTLTFTWDGTNYVYDNSSFFPLDGLLLGNDGRDHNFHFTMELHTSFNYQTGQTFSFTGDDDLWLFINDQLVIDLGGVHAAAPASVDLDSVAATIGIVPGNNYDFDLFFAERHTTQSNFKATTNIALVAQAWDVTVNAEAGGSPLVGVPISGTYDTTDASGTTPYTVEDIPDGSSMELTAPLVYVDGSGFYVFRYWRVGGVDQTPGELTADFDVTTDTTATAVYEQINNFVTGGGNIKSGRKVIWTFGGNVGVMGSDIVGQFEIVDHTNKISWHCHNDFSFLDFTGDPIVGPPGPSASHNTATFVGHFTSNKGGEADLTIIITDFFEPGAGNDTIVVTGDVSFSGNPISGGNFQIHEGLKGPVVLVF
jgi:fibro-slime domain-containing protein